MLKSQNIICISSIDWDFVWQGHQEIMSTFAKNGNRVLFIENTGVRSPTLKDASRIRKRLFNWLKSIKGFRKISENLYIYSPVILPFPYSRLARCINKRLLIVALRRWMNTTEFHDPIIWTFLPTGTALDIINNIENKLLVYYCIADFYELVSNPGKIKKTEDELIKRSDLIFAQGKALEAKCRRFNKNVHIFPFGVNIEAFKSRAYDEKNIPEEIKRIKKPIVGYIGGIHRHIDFKLIAFLARSHPEWSIVLIGPVQTNVSSISGLSNVFLLGQKDFSCLPDYMLQFEIGIIPYELNEYTRTVLPTKLNEYHALGIPAISTDLPEIKEFNLKNDNLVSVAGTYQEFSDYILRHLANKDATLINRRKSSAEKNGWPSRISEMSILMENTMREKASCPVDWQLKFLRLYKTSRRRLMGATSLSIFLYFLIFYTPLIWFVAEPLKISQKPQKADYIVVLAGGVGESGRPGKGYEERVKYAAELYKNGFASNLIFSSGYKYVFEEPLLMKALAVSLGIPPDAIILEDKSVNTYENINFVQEIIGRNKVSTVILVSSPYHMRRVSYVFNKAAKNINVIYAPISDSLYYSHPDRDVNGRKIWKQASYQQIKGILHEYIGILFYWLKGWI